MLKKLSIKNLTLPIAIFAAALMLLGASANAQVVEYDYGDAPDPTYPVLSASNGARHLYTEFGPLLGLNNNPELDAHQDVSADLDISDDGVYFFEQLVPGKTSNVILLINGSPGLVSGWIDFNGDGDWDELNERIWHDVPVTPGVQPMQLTVPSTVIGGFDTYIRVRISTDGLPLPTGPADDGEVEDYNVTIQPTPEGEGVIGFDFGDLLEGNYPSVLADDGARHAINQTPGPVLGDLVDVEQDAAIGLNANGDDINNADDEDGITFMGTAKSGFMSKINVKVTSQVGLLSAWADYNQDGDWDDEDEQIFTDVLLAIGDNELVTSIPASVPQNSQVATRFRISTQAALSYSGLAGDGEVEDHYMPIGTSPLNITGNVVHINGADTPGVWPIKDDNRTIAACNFDDNLETNEYVIGSGTSRMVQVVDSYGNVEEFQAFYVGMGVNVACGDLEADGIDEIIIGKKYGGTEVSIRNMDGSTRKWFVSFAFGLGTTVATANIDDDPEDEILVGKAYDSNILSAHDSNGARMYYSQMFDSEGGVDVASLGDIDDDGYDEIVVSDLRVGSTVVLAQEDGSIIETIHPSMLAGRGTYVAACKPSLETPAYLILGNRRLSVGPASIYTTDLMGNMMSEIVGGSESLSHSFGCNQI